MKSVCVYCGSNPGRSPKYGELAVTLARAMAARDVALVYGGGNLGLMGTLANAVLEAGGRAYGVIPTFMVDKEQAHTGLTELHIVANMSDRKVLMADLADAFITLPGGVGTLEELIETLSWAQLSLHRKPIGVLNLDGFFDPLQAQLEAMMHEGFIPETSRGLVRWATSAEGILDVLGIPGVGR